MTKRAAILIDYTFCQGGNCCRNSVWKEKWRTIRTYCWVKDELMPCASTIHHSIVPHSSDTFTIDYACEMTVRKNGTLQRCLLYKSRRFLCRLLCRNTAGNTLSMQIFQWGVCTLTWPAFADRNWFYRWAVCFSLCHYIFESLAARYYPDHETKTFWASLIHSLWVHL